MSKRTINLREEIAFGGGLRVDRKRGVIFGVKVLGYDSQNGRKYLPEAIKAAKPLYEGIKVNIDHPKDDPSDPRSAYDRLGKLVNVRYLEGKGLYADLVILKAHPMAGRVMEAAERMPDAFGLSHNAQGEGDKKDGIFIVNRISEVRHVDLVADAATVKSLAEGVMSKKAVKQKDQSRAKAKKAAAPVLEADDEKHEEPDGDEGGSLREKLMDILAGDGDVDSKVEAIEALYKEADDSDDDKEAMEAEDEDSEDAEEAEDEDSEKAEDTEEGEWPGFIKPKGGSQKIEAEGDDEDEDDKGKMESVMARKLENQVKALQEEIAKTKTEAAMRDFCESIQLPVTKDLLADLCAMPKDVAQRHAKRLAVAAKATKPKSGIPTLEGKEEKFPSGLDLGNYLSN